MANASRTTSNKQNVRTYVDYALKIEKYTPVTGVTTKFIVGREKTFFSHYSKSVKFTLCMYRNFYAYHGRKKIFYRRQCEKFNDDPPIL